MKVANVVHAAGESAGVPRGTIAIALEAGSEAELKELAAKLTDLDVAHIRVIEGEGEYAGQTMAIGVKPTDNCLKIRRVTGSMPLVR